MKFLVVPILITSKYRLTISIGHVSLTTDRTYVVHVKNYIFRLLLQRMTKINDEYLSFTYFFCFIGTFASWVLIILWTKSFILFLWKFIICKNHLLWSEIFMVRIRWSSFFLFKNSILVPTENVATIEGSAVVSEGVSRIRNALINGDYQSYDWDSGRYNKKKTSKLVLILGYTCHQIGSGGIIIQLCQPYIISSMR